MLSQAVAGVLFQTKIRRSSLILVSLGGGDLSFLFAREWVIERQLKSPLCLPLMKCVFVLPRRFSGKMEVVSISKVLCCFVVYLSAG